MDIVSDPQAPGVYDALCDRLRAGEVAILPTDTLYGLSGDGLDERVVSRIARLKRRDQPPTLIPHSIDWAVSLAEYDPVLARKALEERRGDTLLFPYRAPQYGGPPASVVSSGLISFRLPDHWITELVADVGRPLVSTSVNHSGQEPMTSLESLDDEIRAGVDFIVYEGELSRSASTLVFFDSQPPRELTR